MVLHPFAPFCTIGAWKLTTRLAQPRPGVSANVRARKRSFCSATCQKWCQALYSSERPGEPLPKVLSANHLWRKSLIRPKLEMAENVRFCHAGKKMFGPLTRIPKGVRATICYQ